MKPMLAATWKAERLLFPLLGSHKLDGVRAMVLDGVVVSRNLKAIPNTLVQSMFGREEFEGLDGELVVGHPTDPACFRNTTSGVMSRDTHPDVKFHVFDMVTTGKFADRLAGVLDIVHSTDELSVIAHPHYLIKDLESLSLYESEALERGYEGLILRHPDAPYKHGRSTMREQGMVKVKRFADSEAVVLGMEEKLHNANAAKRNALGYIERSSHKANKKTTGVLGALIVQDIHSKVEFKIGTGFDDALRAELWDEPSVIGKVVKYKFFPTGSKEKPRFPVFMGFRNKDDM